MAITQRAVRPILKPLNAILLAFPIALFTAALVTDIAYLRSAEIQWTNFSAWLITGALVFGGVVLALALIGLLIGGRAPGRTGHVVYTLLLVAMWVLGLINAFQHSRDGWSSVGAAGLILSILTSLLALAAGWIAYSRSDAREIGQ